MAASTCVRIALALTIGAVLTSCSGSAKPGDPTATASPRPTLVAPSPTPDVPPTPPPDGYSTYTDAIPYCAAVGTVDFPARDPRYAGLQQPADITEILKAEPAGTYARPNDYYVFQAFRCAGGGVLVCYYGGRGACGYARTTEQPEQQVIDFCVAHPTFAIVWGNEQGDATIYSWRCIDGVPQIYDTAPARVDDRGFVASQWRAVTP